jgi:predicted transposase YdaD
MCESSTIQAFIEEGRRKGREEGREEGRAGEARKIILRLGRKRLGAVDETVEAKLNEIVDLERLEALTERIDQVSSWDELLAQN